MLASILWWWLSIQLLSLLALPVTAFLFRHVPLRGYPFAKTLGLLLAGYGAWLLAMLQLAPFGAGAVLLAGVLAALAGCWALRRQGLAELLAELRARWPAVLGYELLFGAALYAGLWLRWNGGIGPAALHTEKPMELAFLSGVLRSSTFPPQDPWLAGYPINYYYLGYVLVAGLARLSGASVGAAFNLGVATSFALAALMVAGLVATLLRLVRPAGGLRQGLGAAAASLLGVLLVLLAGNQAGALQAYVGAPEVVMLDGGELVSALRQRLAGAEVIRLSQPINNSSELHLRPDAPFDWWNPSRAVWDNLAGNRSYAITEFPFFSFYLGDMHPHVLAIPFGLLALALALATAVRPAAPMFLQHRRGRLELALSGIVLGSLYAINSWDAPTYLLIYVGALALLYRRLATADQAAAESGAQQGLAWRHYSQTLGSVALAAFLAIAPFLLTFKSLVGSRSVPEPLASIPVLRSLGRIIGPVQDHTDLHEFLMIFGLFFVMLLAYGLSRPVLAEQRYSDQAPPAEDSAPRARRWLAGWLVTLLVLPLGWLVGFPLLALLPLGITLARQAWYGADQPVRAFVLWGVAVGALVLFGVDVVYIRDNFDNRMNTVFKFYYQVWLIWGTLAAYAAWSLLQPPLLRRAATLAWLLPAGLLLVGALVYPYAAVRWGNPWDQRERVLDALAYLERSTPDEAAAIAWVRQHTRSNEIVLTAVGPPDYDSYKPDVGRVAAATGRPTLLGWWISHENLWRSGSPEALAAIETRRRDVAMIYTTIDNAEAQRLLQHHGVRYVYVGPLERRLYPGPGLDKFGQFAELAFQQGQVQIYRVDGAPQT